MESFDDKVNLTKELNPIKVCLYEPPNLRPDLDEFSRDSLDRETTNDSLRLGDLGFRDIDYSGLNLGINDLHYNSENGPVFVMSGIDSDNKMSRGFYNCTGLIVTGKTDNGKNISFLTHQNPTLLSNSYNSTFEEALTKRIVDLKNKSIPGTIDAVYLGGDVDFDGFFYKKNLNTINSVLKKELVFCPVVVNGPKELSKPDHIYYDNENRRVYFFRPKINQ